MPGAKSNPGPTPARKPFTPECKLQLMLNDDDDDDDDDLTVVGPLPRSKENSRKESRRSRAIQSPPPEVTIVGVGHELRYIEPPTPPSAVMLFVDHP